MIMMALKCSWLTAQGGPSSIKAVLIFLMPYKHDGAYSREMA
jgi:hypothetical protein